MGSNHAVFNVLAFAAEQAAASAALVHGTSRQAQDCLRGVHTPPFRALVKGMYPETNTLPKQHQEGNLRPLVSVEETPSLQGGVVDCFKEIKDFPAGRCKLAGEKLISALEDPRYASVLTSELAPLLFPSCKDIQAAEIAAALYDIVNRYGKKHG
jgi:hypothetical protein